jgi:hypothetical protein
VNAAMPSSLHQQFAGLRFDRRSSTENRQIPLTRLKKMHSRKGLLPTHKPMTLPENQTVELKFDIDDQNYSRWIYASLHARQIVAS